MIGNSVAIVVRVQVVWDSIVVVVIVQMVWDTISIRVLFEGVNCGFNHLFHNGIHNFFTGLLRLFGTHFHFTGHGFEGSLSFLFGHYFLYGFRHNLLYGLCGHFLTSNRLFGAIHFHLFFTDHSLLRLLHADHFFRLLL